MQVFNRAKIWGKGLFCLIVLLCFVGFFTQKIHAAAGINHTINFQGKLVNPDGTNVTDNTYSIVFSLYTVSSGGSNAWTETDSVTTKDGVFRVSLGAGTTFASDNIDFNTDTYYLGIKVGSDAEMTPRVQFTAVPYAFNAEKVNGLTVTNNGGNTLNIAANKTLTTADSFTTSGAFPLTLTSTATTNATLPSGTITLVDLASSQTLSTKTLDNTNILNIKDSNFTLQDDGDTSKHLAFQLSGISSSTTRTLTVPDADGTICLQNSASCGFALGTNYWQLSGSTISPATQTNGLAVGTGTRLAGTDLRSISGTQATASVSGATSFAGLVVDNSGKGDIFTASSSGLNRFVITQNGNVGIATTAPAKTLDITGTFNVSGAATVGTLNGNTITSGTGTLTLGAGKTLTVNDTTSLNTNSIGLAGETLTLTSGQNVTFNNGMTLAATNGNTYTFPSVNNGTVLTTNQTSQTINSGQTTGTILAIAAGAPSLSGALTGQSITLNGTGSQNETGLSFAVTAAGGTLKDINGTSGNWSVTSAGAGTFASLTSSGLISANGGLTVASAQNLTLSELTIGSVPFVGASNVLSEDNSNFFWDRTNKRLGIGNNASLLGTLDVRATSGTLAVATVSGKTSFASLVVDNSGVGDIFTASSSGLNRFVITQNGNVGVGTTAPGALFDVNGTARATTLNATTALQTNGTQRIDNSGNLSNIGTIASTYLTTTTNNVNFGGASTILQLNGTTFLDASRNLSNIGTITSSGYAGANAVLYAAPTTGLFSTTTTSTQNQCLLSGNGSSGTPSWGTCALGTNYWQLVGSTISPATQTNGLAVGTTTRLAGSDLRSISGTQATASVSGATSFAGLVVDNSGVGDIFTASSSGLNRFVIAQNGNVGIGTATPSRLLEVKGVSGSNIAFDTAANSASDVNALVVDNRAEFGYNNGVVIIDDNGATKPITFSTAGSERLRIDTGGNVGIGTTSPLSTFDVRAQSGTLAVASISGATSFAGLVVDNSGVGDIFSASKSGATKFVINNSGNIQFNGGTSFLTTLNSAATQARAITFPDAGGTICLQNSASCGFATGTNYWQLVGSTISPLTQTNGFGVGTTSRLAGTDLRSLLGTQATASISGATSFAGLVVDNSGVGDIFTASSSGLNRFVITQNGNVGIGTSTPGTKLQINGTTYINNENANQLTFNEPGSNVGNFYGDNSNNRLYFGASVGSGTVPTTPIMTWDLGTNNVGIGTTSPLANLQIGGTGSSSTPAFLYLRDYNSSANGGALLTGNWPSTNGWGIGAATNSTTDNTLRIGIMNSGSGSPTSTWQATQNLRLLINGTLGNSALAALDLGAATGTLPIASMSGSTSFAGLVVDNSGKGDIFTASSSGLNRFVITQNGNVGIGTTTPSSPLTVSATGATSGNIVSITAPNPSTSFTGNIISASSANHTYLTLNNQDLTLGGHKNNTTISQVREVFTYDTTKDSDGGRWTADAKAQASSWYNESLNTATRGLTRAFPDKAIIAVNGTSGAVQIYDAKDNSLWMQFNKGSGSTSQMVGPTTNSTGSSVYALNGKIYFANSGSVGGLYVLDFKEDGAYRYDGTGYAQGTLSGSSPANIVNRNTTITFTPNPAIATALVSPNLNDVYANIVNGNTYVAVAEAGAANGDVDLINESNESIVSHFGPNANAQNVWLTSVGTLYATIGDASTPANYALKIKYNAQNATFANSSLFDEFYVSRDSTHYGGGTTDSNTFSSLAPTAGPASSSATFIATTSGMFVTQGTSTVDGASDTVYLAAFDKTLGKAGSLMALQTKKGDPSNGSIKYYTSNNITDDMPGDVRAMYPLDGNVGAGLTNTSVNGSYSPGSNLTNSASPPTNYTTTGVRGQAARLASSGLSAVSTHSTMLLNFKNAGGLSASAWVQPTAVDNTNGRRLVWVSSDQNGSANALAWGIGTKGDGANANITCFVGTGTNTITDVGTTIAATNNTWYHVAMTSDSSGNVKCYVNGQLTARSDAVAGTALTPTQFEIGATRSTTAINAVTGNLDEVMVAAETFTSAEISHMYQVGYRALQNHTANTIRGVAVSADAHQQLNGSTNNVNTVAASMQNGQIYVGTRGGGVSVIGMDSDTLTDLYSSSINTTDDTGTTWAANNDQQQSISVAQGYGNGMLLAFGSNNTNNGGVWMESNDSSFKDFMTTNYNPFGATLTQSNLNVDTVLRVTNQISSSLDNDAFGATSSAALVDAFRVDNNGNLLSRSMINSTTAMQFQQSSGFTVLDVDTTNHRLGVNTISPADALDIRASSGTTGIASISGATSFAGLTVDNSGVGDIFTASSSGLNRFVITQNGNVGIGTTAPTATLNVLGSSIFKAVTDSTTAFQFLDSTNATALDIDTINDNVGVGRNPSGTKLDVSTGAFITLRLNQSGSNDLLQLQNTGTTVSKFTNIGALGINTGSNSLLAALDTRSLSGTQPTASFSGATSFAGLVVDNSGVGDIFAASNSGQNRFVITQDGRVGVGTTSPGASVDVEYNDSSANGQPALKIGNNAAGGAPWYIRAGATGTNTPAGGFSIANNSAYWLTINSSGNVGINTTTPKSQFDVEGGNIMIGQQTNTNIATDQTWTKVSQATAGTIASGDSFNIASISASAVYNGSLYVGTYGTSSGSAEIYRYSGSGTTWTKVSQPTQGIIASGGTSTIASVSAMAVYNGYLYAGTTKKDSAEVYRYDGSTNWTKVSGTTGTIGGGATTSIDGVASMTVYNGKLYVGTNEPQKAEVYQYNGGTAWVSVAGAAGNPCKATLVDTITSLASSSNFLYIADSVGNGQAELCRFQHLGFTEEIGGGTPGSFNIYNSGGSVTVLGLSVITQMVTFNGKLYIAFRKKGGLGDLLVYDPPPGNGDLGTTPPAPVNAYYRVNNSPGSINGVTTGIESISSLAVYNGKLYVGTEKSDAAEIYRYEGGYDTSSLWTKVSQNTAGTISSAGGSTANINMISNMIAYNGNLYAGTGEPSKAEIYQFNAVSDQSYALQFHAADTQAGGEQNSMLNTGSISFVASSSAYTNGSFIFDHSIQTLTGAYDYAEDYPTRDDTLSPGDIVSLDPSENDMVKRATPGDSLVGVYSTHPGFELSQADTTINGGRAIPVALTGRVPMNVSTESGEIKIGDLLTTSSQPGIAMKATKPGFIIGKAMEPYNGDGIGSVMTYVNVTWADPGIQLTSNGTFNVSSSLIASLATTAILGDNTATDSASLSATITQDPLSQLGSTVALLQTQYASLSAQMTKLNKLDDLSQRVAALEKDMPLFAASSSGGLINNDATISGQLSVTGKTLLGDVGITGKVSMGLLTIDGMGSDMASPAAEINTLSGPLKFQSLGLEGIDFENGNVTIDTQGNFITKGMVTAKKYNVDTSDDQNASVGEAILLAGETSIDVDTGAVTDLSKIFVTAESVITEPLTVTKKVKGKSFRVEIALPVDEDVKFNWWIVN